MFKNLTDNAKNLAANAKLDDMSRLFKNHMSGKQDVKNAISGVMDISKEVIIFHLFFAFTSSFEKNVFVIAVKYIASREKFVAKTVCRLRCCA